MSRVADRLGEQAAAAVAYTDMGRFWPTWLQELQRQAALLRDIMGNPFRPVRPGPRWLTSAVVSLATASYADRTFDHLPILADALEEAGCANADVLAHCRNGGPHVRGCWVVDLVLGKG